ncbi:peptidoglycan-binding protein [Mesorhizobium sp. M0130]|uniref:peptidoglycan-binding protein n=1 Tax=Mesorhizobium sp. M0130 TaxID=2956887 RepID=UPI0033375A44
MDRNVPKGAAMLLDFIGSIEAPHGYDTVYGNNQAKLPKPLTKMTIDEVIAAGASWTKRFGSSACGKLQFMKATLQRLKKVLGLTGKELLDGPMQEALGYQLLKERGFAEFIAGRRSRTAFGLALAQEWASFPVLTGTKGAHRKVARGETYYAGDRLNKALLAPERVEAMLDKVRAAGGATAAAPQPTVAATPSAAPPVAAEPTTADAPAKETILRVQQQLKDLGYTEVGGVDGKGGTMTSTAIRAFRAENGLPDGDGIDDDLLLALQKAKPRVLAPARTDATPDVVREKVPEVRTNWLTKVGAFFASIFALIGSFFDGIIGNLDQASGVMQPVKDAAGDVPGWVWMLGIAVVAGGLYLIARHGEAKGVEAFQSGARR